MKQHRPEKNQRFPPMKNLENGAERKRCLVYCSAL